MAEQQDGIFDEKRERRLAGRYGGNPTSHTPAHNVPAVAASFRI